MPFYWTMFRWSDTIAKSMEWLFFSWNELSLWTAELSQKRSMKERSWEGQKENKIGSGWGQAIQFNRVCKINRRLSLCCSGGILNTACSFCFVQIHFSAVSVWLWNIVFTACRDKRSAGGVSVTDNSHVEELAAMHLKLRSLFIYW